MVHMHGGEHNARLAARIGHRDQQRHRICPSRYGHGHAFSRVKTLPLPSELW
jgi:hypothetical protein